MCITNVYDILYLDQVELEEMEKPVGSTKPKIIITRLHKKSSSSHRVLLATLRTHFGYCDFQLCPHNQNNLHIKLIADKSNIRGKKNVISSSTKCYIILLIDLTTRGIKGSQ